MTDFKEEFIKNAFYRLDENMRMVSIALDKITEEDVWRKPNKSSNSIANLILHLCGNITQYGISSLQSTEDKRARDEEFTVAGGLTKAQLLEQLESTVNEVKSTILNLPESRFTEIKTVQGYSFSGIGNIIHLVEHFSYHTGQIAFWVKLMKDEQLGFYDGQDLNARSE
ncbi:MAG: hypothetical protein CL868_15280 [Cytophagaceae bacterium]|nr:hypothetical protein [Cytophagaceae bacterium]|tara:strand:- start:701 stop:1207 length:507 start_codon:yes stop_codon:yes gene_type:complete